MNILSKTHEYNSMILNSDSIMNKYYIADEFLTHLHDNYALSTIRRNANYMRNLLSRESIRYLNETVMKHNDNKYNEIRSLLKKGIILYYKKNGRYYPL